MAGSPVGFDPSSAQPAQDGTVQDQIRRAASMAGVPFDIAYRLVKQESSFNPRAKSSAGAMGLTQLMPGTAKMLGVSDPFNGPDNLAGGFKYLSQLYKKYGTWDHALAAYNWGPGNVDSWLSSGANPAHMPAQTRAYVANIAPRTKRGRLQLLGERAKGTGGFDPSSAKPVAGFDPSSAQAAPAASPTPGPNSIFSQHGAQAAPASSSHSFLEELYGVTDLPFELGDAMAEGRLSGQGEFSQVPNIFKTDPATADDVYGYNAKPFLQYVIQHAPHSDEAQKARELLANPTKAGFETFIMEFLNPMNTLTGKGIGRGGTLLHDFLSQYPHGREFLKLFSPFRNIAKVAGDKGKQALAAMINSTRHVDQLAMDEVQRIFGGLTHHEQVDVVRRMQGGKLTGPPQIPGRAASGGTTFVPGAGKVQSAHNLDQRAQMLNQVLRRTTARKIEEGTLPTTSIHNEQTFFPMRGAYRDPRLNDDEFDFMETLRGGNQGAGTYTMPPIYQKTLLNIDDALNSGLLREDFSPSQQLYKHLSRGNQNIAANRALGALPETLIRHPENEGINANPLRAQQAPPEVVKETRGGPTLPGQFSQPALRPPKPDVNFKMVGSQLATKAKLPATPEQDIYKAFYEARPGAKAFHEQPPPGWVEAEHVFPGARLLPALKGAWLKKEFAEWLRDHGGSSLTGQPTKLFGSEGFAQWVNRYNSAMRQAVIANPAYHLLWNIAWNGSTAMGDSPVFLVGNTARAVLGASKSLPGVGPMIENLSHKIGETKLYSMFMGNSEDWANDVRDAIQAGATAEFGATHSVLGGHAADLFTRPWGDLSFSQKLDKMFTSLTDWNKRAVFGEHGEQAFATRLYTRLLKRGYDQGTAATMTREALGNYQNVDPNNIMSQLFFFYPWLKSNTAFWTKAFLTRPAMTAAPLEGIRRHNQIADDPNFSGQYPTPDLTIYQGQQGGQARYFTPPLPQRTAANLLNAASTGDPFEMFYQGSNIAASHANPLVGNAISALSTIMAQRKEGLDPAVGTNYDIMFDKDAPRAEKFKQLGGFLASHDIPVPLVQYAIQDAVRQGWTPEKLRDTLLQSGGLGFPHGRPTLQQSKQINSARTRFERFVHNINKQMHPSSGQPTITPEQAQARIQRAYALYKKRRDEILGNSK